MNIITTIPRVTRLKRKNYPQFVKVIRCDDCNEEKECIPIHEYGKCCLCYECIDKIGASMKCSQCNFYPDNELLLEKVYNDNMKNALRVQVIQKNKEQNQLGLALYQLRDHKGDIQQIFDNPTLLPLYDYKQHNRLLYFSFLYKFSFCKLRNNNIYVSIADDLENPFSIKTGSKEFGLYYLKQCRKAVKEGYMNREKYLRYLHAFLSSNNRMKNKKYQPYYKEEKKTMDVYLNMKKCNLRCCIESKNYKSLLTLYLIQNRIYNTDDKYFLPFEILFNIKKCMDNMYYCWCYIYSDIKFTKSK